MRRLGMLVAVVGSLLIVAMLPVALLVMLTMVVDWRAVLQVGVERDSQTRWTARIHAGDDPVRACLG